MDAGRQPGAGAWHGRQTIGRWQLLLALAIASACAADLGSVPTVATGMTTTKPPAGDLVLGVGESVTVGQTTVTFVRVAQDSRCPKGVTCVWAGDAVVELGVELDGRSSALELHTNSRFQQTGEAAGLRLTLERLEPYPEAGRTVEAQDYRAYLTVADR